MADAFADRLDIALGSLSRALEGRYDPCNEVEPAAMSTLTAIPGRMATCTGKRVRREEAFSCDVCLTTDAEDWTAEAPITPDDSGRYAAAGPGISMNY